MVTFNKVSIIIPAFNEQANIGRCIMSIERLLLPEAMTHEIIVVDNGSVDRTVELAQKYLAKVLVKEQIHIGALRNLGATHAQGDLLAFVDADCLVSRRWLLEAVACMEREAACAVGAHHVLPAEAGWLAKSGEIIQSYKKGELANYIPSGNLIVARQVFAAVAGFDETLETNEDVDFCHRLRQRGYKIFVDPRIVSVHLGYPKGIGAMIRREMWHGKNTTTLFLNELKKMINGNVVLFSLIYLSLLMAIGFSTILFFVWGIVPLMLSLLFFVLFIFSVSLRKYGEKLPNLPRVIVYVLVYGLGRSAGMMKTIMTIGDIFSCSWRRK